MNRKIVSLTWQYDNQKKLHDHRVGSLEYVRPDTSKSKIITETSVCYSMWQYKQK